MHINVVRVISIKTGRFILSFLFASFAILAVQDTADLTTELMLFKFLTDINA